MAGEYQKELFSEFKEEKGKLEQIVNRIAQKKRKLYVHLPLENIVFAAIIMIVCFIVTFALGVERGKRLASSLEQKISASPAEVARAPQAEQKPVKIYTPVPVSGVIDGEKNIVQESVKAQAKTCYTIQLVAYTDKRLAENEKKKLVNKKIEASITPSGRWYQVSAGVYTDINDAKKALKEFQKEYKGCFIRNK